MKKVVNLSNLRTIALIAIVVGVLGALILVLHAGRYNSSILLRLLFVIWVVSPFIAFIMADKFTRNWPVITHAMLYILILILTITPLLFYSGVLTLNRTKPAFVFLVIPFISWLLLLIFISIAATIARRNSSRKNNV
jgi:hypothetical protein